MRTTIVLKHVLACFKPGPKAGMGFTLVELSIVIVIIGLIIAGVTSGSSLINSAKLSAQIADLQKYRTAFNAFIMQYNAVPGDMANATSYWPSAGATNGNGDGRLTYDADNGSNNITTHENLTLFQHLSLAGLISGNYNNTNVMGVGFPILKVNSRKGMIAAGLLQGCCIGYTYQLSDAGSDILHIAALYLNVRDNSNIVDSTFNDDIGTLTASQAYNIDVKIDDGVARAGSFKSYTAHGSTQGNCLTGTDGNYLISNSILFACDAEFILK